MDFLNRFYILKTSSSEVHKRTLFKNRWTSHIPDLFFALCFATLFFFAHLFDKVFTVLLFFHEKSLIGASAFATSVLVSFVCLCLLEKSLADMILGYTMPAWCSSVLILIGCGPLLICGTALRHSFSGENDLKINLKYYSYPIFHIKETFLNTMKVYCILSAALKSIPQLYIVSVLIKERHITGAVAVLGLISLFVNMILFSLTMAVTFPIRSTPRVFTTSFCVPLNAFCKFMATLCGCGINMAIFAMLFSSVGYYALLIHALRAFLWIWPSWWVLKTQPHILSGFYFTMYISFLTLIFSFIYIHPFEGKGKLIYYFFYLMKFWTEIFCIYALTDASDESICIYFALKAVMMGYLSCYGLINILLKHKSNKSGFLVALEVQQKDQQNAENTQERHTEEADMTLKANEQNTDNSQENLTKSDIALKNQDLQEQEIKVNVDQQSQK